MEKQKIKSISIIVLIIALTTSAILTIFPFVIAQGVYAKKTYPFIGATPNPVGVNQQTLVHAGITDEMQKVQDKYEGLMITVEKTDCPNETLGSIRRDIYVNYRLMFEPKIPGKYQIIASFEGTKSYCESVISKYLPEDQTSASTPIDIVVIIVTIVIIGGATYWFLKRK